MSIEWLTKTFQMDVVCLIRHPAAVVASLKRVNWRFDFGNFLRQPQLMDDWLSPFAHQLESPPTSVIEEGALLWACVYFVLISCADRHPSWLFYRLEDIGADPLTRFRSMYERLRLPYTRRIRRSIGQYCDASNPAEVPVTALHVIRRNSRELQRLWRNRLEPEEVSRIRNIVEPLSSRCYSDRDWAQ